VGTKLTKHLKEKYEVVLIDLKLGTSLLEPITRLTNYFQGVDTVFHFAAKNPFPEATWEDSICSMDMTANVFLAAIQMKVRRVVLASSNHVMGGLKEEGVNIHTAKPITSFSKPKPGTHLVYPLNSDSTPYAVAKLFGERLAYALSHSPLNIDTCFIALRIGWCMPKENQPKDSSPAGTVNPDTVGKIKSAVRGGKCTKTDPEQVTEWFQLMWLSNRDFLQICEKVITADFSGKFHIFNAMSRNTGMRWDLAYPQRILGYNPKDDVTKHPRPNGDGKIGIYQSLTISRERRLKSKL